MKIRYAIRHDQRILAYLNFTRLSLCGARQLQVEYSISLFKNFPHMR